MLRHLRENGVEAPKNTPQYGKKYEDLSTEFKKIWQKEASEMTLADYDLHIWKKYAKSKKAA